MAWENLLDASFRGVQFNCVSTDDEADRALAEHAYPYVDGADNDDLGENARIISVEAVFWGDNYARDLDLFMKAFRQQGAGELIHPVFGSIKNAQPAGYKIHHEADDADFAKVSLRFKESTPSPDFFSMQLPGQKASAISSSIQTVRDRAADVLAAEVSKISGVNNVTRLDQLRGSMLSVLTQLRQQASQVILSGLDTVNYPRAWASDVSSLISGIVDLRVFDVNTLFGDWRYLQDRFSTAILLPAQSGQPVSDSQLINNHIALEQALGMADTTQIILASEVQSPTLTSTQVESITNAPRAAIQDVITSYRDQYPIETSRPVVEALKQTAYNLQVTAQSVIEAKPPLVTRQVEAPGNLRLLAHKWYGDHNRAAELLRLNGQLRQPNFISTGDQLNAYSR
ncbi:DNA circularization N-terminal domain-containing protein [Methylophilus sp. YYY-1]|uniref:DNA circularization protein n=1 Tax=Methylophilus sp. YYY-1 TaxID=2682087 RepID=UPI0023B24EE3|nr:DNA circularization N-terminal domain-containing protein [Methylophilus sp. YYY-1]MDF0377700.1 DNA circulation family protein [Methylophilus sp. YYY-1]